MYQSVRTRWIALFACCMTMVVGVAFAAENEAADKAGKAHQEMMEMMMKAGAPGAAHEMMKKCEGTWKASVKSWEGPGDPMLSEGTAEFKMILGGRFLEQKFTGTMMNMPYEGYGLSGYDNMKKMYTTTWFDNMNTSAMNATGSYSEAKKTLTYKASSIGMDGKPMNVRMTNVMPDDNTQVFTMYGVDKGKEMKMMEITYTRM